VDEGTNNPFDDSGEVVRFHTGSASNIKPYLGVKDDVTWSYLGGTHGERVTNLINYLRGNDNSALRTRTIDGNVWKLGDIVNSTPVSISEPPDNYHIIYSDESYQTYFNANNNRENVVYVGANDGMLHAFTSWVYDSASGTYTQPTSTTEQIGDELWAYVPQSLLPHLKWLPSPDYTHVDYVDLKPKVFDAKIDHDNNPSTPDEWRTLLLAGLNMGGKHIQVSDDFDYNNGTPDEIRDFYPTYVCMDVTDPRNPRLLWERTYADLEMSMSVPAIARVKDKWFAVFGSGPGDYDGTSAKKGHIFVVDLKTGDPYKSGTNDWLFETNESYAFMNSPVSLDKDLNFNVDAIYFGETYAQGVNWRGKVYKVTVPWVDLNGDYDGSDLSNYVENPLDATNPWQLSTLFDATRPITAPLTLSTDEIGNAWIYGGTGRYFNTDDKANDETQYLFGFKDPFFNIDHTLTGLYGDDYYHNYSSSLELQMSNLFNSDPYVVSTEGEVFESSIYFGTWEDLLTLVHAKDGWVKSLSIQKERVLEKAAILGGVVFVPSFVPNSDICGFGGDSYLNGVYYETGTAYFEEAVFPGGTDIIQIDGQDVEIVLDKTALGAGKASSLGIHIGMEEGATGFVQQSTGSVVTKNLNPAFKFKSGLRAWREK